MLDARTDMHRTGLPEAARAAQRIGVRLDTSLELLLEGELALKDAHAQPAARVLATVVATAGSTYRKAGARMMLMADGRYIGLLSGGCLESDLQLHAREVMMSGKARAVEYDMRGPDDVLFGIGAGCEGAMRVLLEPADRDSGAARALNAAGKDTRAGRPTVLIAVHESAGLPLGTYGAQALPPALLAAAGHSFAAAASHEMIVGHGASRLRALVHYLPPAPHLLICGAGQDSRPVVAAARAMGWRVTVVDHRPAYIEALRCSGAALVLADAASLCTSVNVGDCHAAVVMSHHLISDVAYLRALAACGAPDYVGLLGPAARRHRIAQEMGPAIDALRSRLHGPVGLDIGAVTPEAIAIAIVGEVHAWLAGRMRGEKATAR